MYILICLPAFLTINLHVNPNKIMQIMPIKQQYRYCLLDAISMSNAHEIQSPNVITLNKHF